MFISTKGFKRMIKEADKAGSLILANSGKHITIEGGWWIIRILKDKIPKKELAAIIELAGCLPDEGEKFVVTKYGNQYQLDRIGRSMPLLGLAKEQLKVTDVLLGNRGRVLQNPDTCEIIVADAAAIDQISTVYTDEGNGETPVEGPLTGDGIGLFYTNNVMTLYLLRADAAIFEGLIRHLEGIRIERDEISEGKA